MDGRSDPFTWNSQLKKGPKTKNARSRNCAGLEILNLLKKPNFMAPFLWVGFNCLKATATSSRQFTFYHSVPRNSWCSIYQPQKDERLSRPWSHPGVLNTGPLDWESSAFTTSPLKVTQKPVIWPSKGKTYTVNLWVFQVF